MSLGSSFPYRRGECNHIVRGSSLLIRGRERRKNFATGKLKDRYCAQVRISKRFYLVFLIKKLDACSRRDKGKCNTFMFELTEGLKAAFWLVITLDPELWEISLRSLRVTLTALLIASLIAMPLGTYLAVQRFRHRRIVIAFINALMGLPPVVVGLVVYILLSRSGPFGVFNLLFTPTAMIVAQVVIITPLIASIAHQSMRELWAEYHDLLISLNTSKIQRILTLIRDGRRNLLTAALAGFGRAIGEVGAIMIVGGNIDNVTRVLTTAIALETGKGDFALALGLGFVLIGIAVLVNIAIHTLSRTEREGRW